MSGVASDGPGCMFEAKRCTRRRAISISARDHRSASKSSGLDGIEP